MIKCDEDGVELKGSWNKLVVDLVSICETLEKNTIIDVIGVVNDWKAGEFDDLLEVEEIEICDTGI